jgi:hypothetical protein
MVWGFGARMFDRKLLLHGARGTLNLGTHKTVLYQDVKSLCQSVLNLYQGVLSLYRDVTRIIDL